MEGGNHHRRRLEAREVVAVGAEARLVRGLDVARDALDRLADRRRHARRSRSRLVTTKKRQGCLLLAEGAVTAAASRRSMRSRRGGSGRNRRTLRRDRIELVEGSRVRPSSLAVAAVDRHGRSR